MQLSLRRLVLCLLLLAFTAPVFAQIKPGRDPNQPVDEEYTRKIREYTTEPYFSSPLVDYLPASQTVPTPKAVIGDIAGAPGKLPYTADVNRYMHMLEKASPRVRVYSIGTSEEGREMIAVAVASEKLLAQLDENRARLAKLADPRTINLDVSEAELAKRRAGWKAPERRFERGYGWMFTRHIKQANEGCDFDFLETGFGAPVDEPSIY